MPVSLSMRSKSLMWAKRRALGVVDPALDDRHQHVFVVAAVEDGDLAGGGHLAVDAPQVIVRALLVGRCLPADGANAERAHLAEHAADRAVLAAGVGALQDDQHLEATVGVEQVLEVVELDGELGDPGLVGRLVAARERPLGRIEPGEVESARRLPLAGLPPSGAAGRSGAEAIR